MMQHPNLRFIASLVIGLLALPSRQDNVVHGFCFTAPIIRGTAINTSAKPIIDVVHNNNNRIPSSFKAHHIYSPRILAPFTTAAIAATVVVLQAERTNIAESDDSSSSSSSNDANEIIARRIIVVGDVDGGYYRSCVKNEASRFRKLIGTMSPPANEKRAEIYVEGKRKMVEGFVRWCKRGDVGLSQSIKVDSIIDEYPTGLYDDFYVATGRE